VLPFGARSQPEIGDIAPGTDPGAPVAPRLAGKVIWTTLIPAAVSPRWSRLPIMLADFRIY
jgi:predicted secreted protein